MSTLRTCKLGLFILAAFFSIPGWSGPPWDGTYTGTINNIQITEGASYAFRITLGGISSMCNGGGFAFLNEADSNYRTYTAALMMAYAMGKTVTIYSNTSYGHCRIGHISLHP